jgi:hypothetical protein
MHFGGGRILVYLGCVLWSREDHHVIYISKWFKYIAHFQSTSCYQSSNEKSTSLESSIEGCYWSYGSLQVFQGSRFAHFYWDGKIVFE